MNAKTLEQYKEILMNGIMAGMRKGVDGENMTHLRHTVNPLFYNSDPDYVNIADEAVECMANATAQAYVDNLSCTQIAPLFQNALPKEFLKSKGNNNLTSDNQGLDCFKFCLPIYLDSRQKIDWNPENPKSSPSIYWLTEGNWQKTHNGPSSEALQVVGATILKMIEMFPDLKESFAPLLVSKESQIRQEIYDLYQLVTLEEWESLAEWFK